MSSSRKRHPFEWPSRCVHSNNAAVSVERHFLERHAFEWPSRCVHSNNAAVSVERHFLERGTPSN